MTLSKTYVVLTIGALALVGSAGAVEFRLKRIGYHQAAAPIASSQNRGGDVLSLIDTSDIRQVVGFRDNVFVGKVIQQTDSKALGGVSELWYAVDVLMNIKGNLKGTVVVLVGPNVNNSLGVGATYVLATDYVDEKDWHAIMGASDDRRLITENANLSDSDLMAIAERSDAVRHF